MQLGRVFISSVFKEMGGFRDTAAQAAHLVGLEPVLTEHLIAQPSSVRSILENEIAACDTYVGRPRARAQRFPGGEVTEYDSGLLDALL